jgi:predicted transcriptional regulator
MSSSDSAEEYDDEMQEPNGENLGQMNDLKNFLNDIITSSMIDVKQSLRQYVSQEIQEMRNDFKMEMMETLQNRLQTLTIPTSAGVSSSSSISTNFSSNNSSRKRKHNIRPEDFMVDDSALDEYLNNLPTLLSKQIDDLSYLKWDKLAEIRYIKLLLYLFSKF